MLNKSTALSEERTRTLLNSMELNWTSQMQQKESHTHQQLQLLREQLEQSKQVCCGICVCVWGGVYVNNNEYISLLLQIWAEQEALATAALSHLGNQNMKVTVAVITRQKDLRDR